LPDRHAEEGLRLSTNDYKIIKNSHPSATRIFFEVLTWCIMRSVDLHVETPIMRFRFRVASVVVIRVAIVIVVVVVFNTLPLC